MNRKRVIPHDYLNFIFQRSRFTMSSMSVRTDPEQELESLIRRAQREGADAVAAFEAIYFRYAQNVLAFVTTRRRGPLDPDDLASETWLKVRKSLSQFQSGNFNAWLFAVARSVVFDDGRKQRNHPQQQSLEAAGEPAVETAIESVRIQYLRECLAELESEFIQTLRLKIECVPTAEIARHTGVSEATVYTRISRGKELLEECVRRKES